MPRFDDSKVQKWRKKPVVVEAIAWYGDNLVDIVAFVGHDLQLADPKALMIPTLEGDMKANLGDYIIKGVAGEFYPCKPFVFGKTYEPAMSPVRTPREWVEHAESIYEMEPNTAYAVMCESEIRCPVCGSPIVHVHPLDHKLGEKLAIRFLCAEDASHEVPYKGESLRLH